MANRKLCGTTFEGYEASDYAKKNGYLDYGTLAKAFDLVLHNSIMEVTYGIGEWELENGFENDVDEEWEQEISQYYIISDMGATILKEWTNEIVFYNQELDMYVWGVTHYGTSWDYVLTNIELNSDEGKGERKDE